ncbi:MAG: hypothetical protein LC121_22340 [Anaerolineae bacterium]|nr:hypothetical protein [Anaerolineae bacterium]
MIDRFQILITADLTDQGMALLNSAGDVEVEQVNPTNAPRLRVKLATALALIARDDVVIDRAARRRRFCARDRAGRRGVSGIDLETATSRGIIVMNAPGVNAIAAGELTLTLMLALSRSLIDVHNSLKSGFWLLDRKRQAGTQLSGKTLGLIGLGRVGTIVAQRCLSFGMTVLAYDPYIADDQLDDKRVTLVGLASCCRSGRHIRSATARRAASRRRRDQPNGRAFLINTAHGSVVDEAAVAAALKDGRLAGVGTDVYSEEPPYNSPLIGMTNVIHTPHIGDNTVEATGDLSLLIVTQVLDALRGEDYRNVVNMPFVPGMDFEAERPYLQLAERIGALIPCWRATRAIIKSEYRGEDDMNVLIKPVTVAILKGLSRRCWATASITSTPRAGDRTRDANHAGEG